MLTRTHRPEAGLFQLLKSARQIGDLRDRQMHDGARRGLEGADAHARGALVRDYDTRSPHHLGGSHDGPKVALVGHVVEDHHKCGTGAGSRDDIGDVGIREGADLEHDPLMSPVTRQLRQPFAADVLDWRADLGERGDELLAAGVTLARGDEGAAMREPGAKRLGHGAAALDIETLVSGRAIASRGRPRVACARRPKSVSLHPAPPRAPRSAPLSQLPV